MHTHTERCLPGLLTLLQPFFHTKWPLVPELGWRQKKKSFFILFLSLPSPTFDIHVCSLRGCCLCLYQSLIFLWFLFIDLSNNNDNNNDKLSNGASIGWRQQAWKRISFLAMLNIVQVKEEEETQVYLCEFIPDYFLAQAVLESSWE